jgi:HlyD family secretion protein
VELQADSVSGKGLVRALDAGLRTQSRTGFVYVDLPADSGFRVGTFAQGRIGHGQRNVQVLPSAAVVRRDGFAYVFVVKNDAVSLTRISVGDQRAEQFEVLAGLQPEQQVVASGAGFLADGDRIEIIRASVDQATGKATANASVEQTP